MCSIPFDTPQIGRNEKLKEWVVLDGMSSIILHFIPFIFYKTKQWILTLSHFTQFHSTTFHQSKHSLSEWKIVVGTFEQRGEESGIRIF
jgi:hypothetical protein